MAATGVLLFIASGSEVPFMRFAESFSRKWGILVVIIAAAAATGIRWGLYTFELSAWTIYATSLIQRFSAGLLLERYSVHATYLFFAVLT